MSTMYTLNAMYVALDKIICKGIEIFRIMHNMCQVEIIQPKKYHIKCDVTSYFCDLLCIFLLMWKQSLLCQEEQITSLKDAGSNEETFTLYLFHDMVYFQSYRSMVSPHARACITVFGQRYIKSTVAMCHCVCYKYANCRYANTCCNMYYDACQLLGP